jgi:hypothetical protein
MARYRLFVHGVDSDHDPAAGKLGAYGSAEEAEVVMAATGVFNQKLVAEESKARRGTVEVRPFAG